MVRSLRTARDHVARMCLHQKWRPFKAKGDAPQPRRTTSIDVKVTLDVAKIVAAIGMAIALVIYAIHGIAISIF
jgi:hypothetical protein